MRLSALTSRLLGCALGLSLLGAAAPALAAPNVILTVPSDANLPPALAATLAKWRQSGQVSDVVWLDRTQKSGGGFQTFVDIEFPSEAAYNAWRAKDAGALPAPLSAARVDTVVEGVTWPRDSNYSVFKVVEAQPAAPAAEVAAYARNYVRPLLEAERAAKILLRYSFYQERRPDGHGRVWLLEEYRNPTAFARAGEVESGLIQSLSGRSPEFAQAAQARARLFPAMSETVSRYAELPPPVLADLPSYTPSAHLTGTLRIYGSELKNAVEYLAKGFQAVQPDLKVTWSNATSSEGAIAGLYTGISDVAPMGDDAKLTDEMPFFNVFGYLPSEISVATGGYEKRGSLWAWAMVVDKDNPLDQISVDELKGIFGAPRSGGWKPDNNNWLYTAEFARGPAEDIRRWDELGLGREYKGKQIQTYGYVAPGFQIYFERNWFHWSHKWNPNLLEYVERKEAVEGPLGERVWSERPLEILSKDKFGIGIAALMHVRDYPNLKVLKISEHKGGPYVELTPENVANRSYPLKRDAYFYVNKPPGRPLDPMVREFMRFVLSREGQEIIARVGYYYPLDARYLEQQRRKLD